jgi:hypothetical protein
MTLQHLLGHYGFRVSSFDALRSFKLWMENNSVGGQIFFPSTGRFGNLEITRRTWEQILFKARSPKNHRNSRVRPLNQSYLAANAGISILFANHQLSDS